MRGELYSSVQSLLKVRGRLTSSNWLKKLSRLILGLVQVRVRVSRLGHYKDGTVASDRQCGNLAHVVHVKMTIDLSRTGGCRWSILAGDVRVLTDFARLLFIFQMRRNTRDLGARHLCHATIADCMVEFQVHELFHDHAGVGARDHLLLATGDRSWARHGAVIGRECRLVARRRHVVHDNEVVCQRRVIVDIQ